MESNEPSTNLRTITRALTIISVVVALYGLTIAKNFLIPLCWSFIFALIIKPPSVWLERRIKNRAVSIILCIFVLFLLFLGLFYVLLAEAYALTNEAPEVASKFSDYLLEFRRMVENRLQIPYQEQPNELIKRLTSFLQESLGTITGTLSGALTTVVMVGLVPVYMFFFLFYRHKVRQFIFQKYGEDQGENVLQTTRQALEVVQRYLGGLLIDTAFVAVLAGIVFLSLGVDHVFFFALFVAILNLIPYLGVFIASTVSVLYVFLTTDALIYPILTLLLLWGIQLLENNIIKPYVVGKQVKLNPFAVLLAIIVGGLLWGASGMVLSIPFLGMLKIFFEEIPHLRPYIYLLGEDE